MRPGPDGPGGGKGDVVDRDKAIPMIHRAFEGGVNYVDTAVGYCNSDSQRAVGQALKGFRDRVVVSTKNPYYDEDEMAWWKNLEDSLERLGVEQIDVYNHHGMNHRRWPAVVSRVGKWMTKARDQGLVKHVCCSFHDNNEFLRELVDSGYPEVITLQYNLLDRQLEDGIARAREKGVGVVVMGPVAGGRLGASSEVFETMLPEVRRVPELALRFVLSNPNVSVALSGMSDMRQVEENLATASDTSSLTGADRAAVEEHLARLKEMADLYCSGCGYCMPCPSGVNIPKVFRKYNEARVYGLWDNARKAYAGLVDAEAGGGFCSECGECLEKCPQGIPVPERLKEADERLSAEGRSSGPA
jgi:hypothetical protein